MSQADNPNDSKRRRACDVCRRSKIKCEPPLSHDEPCKHCARFHLDCTFVESSKKRGPPKGYVVSLEKRCEHLEGLLKRVAPRVSIDDEIGPSFTLDTWSESVAAQQRSGRSLSPTDSTGTYTSDTKSPSDEPPSNYVPNHVANWPEISGVMKTKMPDLERDFGNLNLEQEVGQRFHGQSSGFNLVKAAISMKEDVVGKETKSGRPAAARPQFWNAPKWKKGFMSETEMPKLVWPPDYLMPVLFDFYFTKPALMLPIIHRATFEANFKAGLHKTDVWFAKLVLLVCAVASRFTNDPEVYLPGDDGQLDRSSAGWKYFSQVSELRGALLSPATLTNLQCYVLTCIYLQYTGAAHTTWLISGIGIRYALDIGLHREKVYQTSQPLQNEMWKRTFWALVSIDIMASARLGRPTAVALDEIDTSFPLELGDEAFDETTQHWDLKASASTHVSAFVHWLKLQWIHGQILKTIYSVPEPAPTAIQEIDAALDAWSVQLPPMLQWETPGKTEAQLQQSALIRLAFLAARITSHRRYILDVMGSKDITPESLKAMQICTDAARACLDILEFVNDVQVAIMPLVGFSFAAATILLLHVWYLRRKSPNDPRIVSYCRDVQRCKATLKIAETGWSTAGKLLDVLNALDEVPVSEPKQVGSKKRERDTEDDSESSQRRTREFRPFVQDQPNEDLPSRSGFSLIPGVPDLGAVQWYQPGQLGQLPFGSDGPFMGSAGFDANYQSVTLPDDSMFLQNLFGSGGSDMFAYPGAGSQQPNDGIDWAQELKLLGLNQDE